MTPQDCAIESIRHSSLTAEPSGVPSSKKARRYQSPSHPWLSSASFRAFACSRHGASAAGLPALLGDARELAEVGVEEPAEPDALALAVRTDAVHAVVPVSRAHERQSMTPDREAPIEGPRAVLEEGRGFGGHLRLEVTIDLARRERRRRKKRHRLVEHAAVAGDLEVVVRRVGEPEQVIGDPGAHAAAPRGRATSAGRRPPRTAGRRRAAGARASAPAARP